MTRAGGGGTARRTRGSETHRRGCQQHHSSTRTPAAEAALLRASTRLWWLWCCTGMVAFSIVLSIMMPSAMLPLPGAEAIKLHGGGVALGSDLVKEWASAYGYARDDIALVYEPAVDQREALAMYNQGQTDFFTSFVALNASASSDPDRLQIPLAGMAMVPAYAIGSLPASATLRLDPDVLGRIWAGAITNWNHPDVADANLNVTMPADLPIVLVFDPAEEQDGGLGDAFKKSLAAISPTFAQALATHGPGLASVLAAAGVTNYRTVTASRVSTVAILDGAMTYAALEEMNITIVRAATMRWGNNTVSANATAVTETMASFISTISNSTTGNINIFNPDTPTGWPLSTLLFVSMRKERIVPGTVIACQYIEETLLFLSWTQLNDKGVAIADAKKYVGMPFAYRRLATAILEEMTCDGRPTLTTGLVVGSGAANDVYPPLAYRYPSSAFQIKYYGSTTREGIRNMANASFDFGIISSSLSPFARQYIPDVAVLPITAMAIVPIYNVPELVGSPPLVLSLPLIADIYLGKIIYWNDSAILALNPNLTGTLPHHPIRIVYQNALSTITTIYSKALARSSPEFNATVTTGNTINFPVKNSSNTILIPDIRVVQAVSKFAYTLTLWVYNIVSSERKLAVAKLRNVAGNDVEISQQTITSALDDLIDEGDNDLINAPGNNSWPIISINSIIIRQSSMKNCDKAALLLDWIYWTQNSTEAINEIIISGMGVVSNSDHIRRQMYKFLVNVTCQGKPVSSLAGCVTPDGLLCSDRGTCSKGVCTCFEGYTGSLCETVSSSSSSTDSTTIVIGVVVPLAVIIFLILLCVIIALVVVLFLKRKKRDDWEIDFNEVEMGPLLGAGGYGEVYKAMWKGTEVAVKMMSAEAVSKDAIKGFNDEIRVMTALRHPNVVLFMAACTRPPNMAIVMEFMALGSLYDLLSNDLVDELPHILKVRMAYQAAKGMHFLHSSGIVHRDLKSLNLLLDNKWNVKVSDFGLTKFKSEISSKIRNEVTTIQWAAPEVLAESRDVDYVLADVYSFGIILWELLTREQPYYGYSPSAVAVAVLRDQARPPVPDSAPLDYQDLMTACWHSDPTVRPTFLEIMTRLSGMIEGTNSSSSITDREESHPRWSPRSSPIESERSSEYNSGSEMTVMKPPEGEVTIVFSDITRAASLWEANAPAMQNATLLHNALLRSLIRAHRGHEALMRNAGEGSFCIAFQQTLDAVEWCIEAQSRLMAAHWPEELLKLPDAAPEWGDDDVLLYRGPRVRMGIHVGVPKLLRDPMTQRYEYTGSPVNLAARITAHAQGGHVLMSSQAYDKIKHSHLATEEKRLLKLGVFDFEDVEGVHLYELQVPKLEGRSIGKASEDQSCISSSVKFKSDSYHYGSDFESYGSALESALIDERQPAEDSHLNSANFCRWIIRYEDIKISNQVGAGSYGRVYRGQWNGIDVAVKRIIKQNLDERKMLEFRTEVALLSDLHHPNIVLFIGACLEKPNLAIVTEFMKQGSLKHILESTIKLPFPQRLKMLRDAAAGINYLHSRNPSIIHRDIKPSNLLVDESWNVKVGDFGLARIKDENATMTRCGTPAWTAPEIIRGDKYNEKADLFSFGIVMWEMLTRKQPFAGRNFMEVSLAVIEGKRPSVPVDCPPGYRKIMKKCWRNKPEKRPTMEDVIAVLDSLMGDSHDSEA